MSQMTSINVISAIIIYFIKKIYQNFQIDYLILKPPPAFTT